MSCCRFFFQAEDGIREVAVTGVQTCALPIWRGADARAGRRPDAAPSGGAAGRSRRHRPGPGRPVVAGAASARVGRRRRVPVAVGSGPRPPDHAAGRPLASERIPMRLGRALVLPVALSVGLAGGMVAGIVAQGQPLDDVPGRAPAAATPPPVNPIVPATLLAWTPGGLPARFADRVSKLRGVDHVVAVESGIAWLSRSYSATGAVVDRPPRGLAIPLEVAAATPARYAPFLAPGDRTVLPALAKGEAVLGASSAALRHLGAGAVLRLGPIRLRVAGVLPDAEVGAHELFVSRATARRLGVTVDRYLLIDPAPGRSRE